MLGERTEKDSSHYKAVTHGRIAFRKLFQPVDISLYLSRYRRYSRENAGKYEITGANVFFT